MVTDRQSQYSPLHEDLAECGPDGVLDVLLQRAREVDVGVVVVDADAKVLMSPMALPDSRLLPENFVEGLLVHLDCVGVMWILDIHAS